MTVSPISPEKSDSTVTPSPELDLVTEMSKFLHYCGYTTVPDCILRLLPARSGGELSAATEALAAPGETQQLRLVDGGAS